MAATERSTVLTLAGAYVTALRRFFGKRAAPADADDLVQEVLLRMQGRRADTRIENVEGYLFTVARRVLHQRRITVARHG